MNVKRPLFNYLVLLLAMFVFSELQAQQISRELIIREFGRLKFLSKESATQLAFDDVQGSSAVSERQGRKVTINLPELHRLANRTAPIYTTAVVRMVLAHEMAHQMQYTHEQGKNSPVVNECQADLVCGFLIAQQFFYDFVTKLIENENKSVTNELIKEGTERLNNVSIVVFSSIFLLGDDFNPDNTHPRNDQRLAALRDGLSYGAMYLMYENFNLLPNDLKISTKTSMDSIKKVLNFWENENVITWSQKHARRITHENINHCKDIVVYNEWSWDTAKSHPYLSYAQTIKNIGNKKIYLNFYNQIRTKVRTKPDSVFYWQTTATNSHIATLGPGATKSLSDSLKWYGDRVVMPSVLLFGNPNSLYTCTCSDDA
ncbi:MAG TPA: hypothetical protein VK625_13795, partial [Flavitalea sp.]|nr:hypothetical protein [Flavitalea sp.]